MTHTCSHTGPRTSYDQVATCDSPATYVVHTECFDSDEDEGFVVSGTPDPASVLSCTHHLGEIVGSLAVTNRPERHAHFNIAPLDC